jgi:hypothetical protein
MSNDQNSSTPESGEKNFSKVHELASGKAPSQATPEYRPPASVAELRAQVIEAQMAGFLNDDGLKIGQDAKIEQIRIPSSLGVSGLADAKAPPSLDSKSDDLFIDGKFKVEGSIFPNTVEASTPPFVSSRDPSRDYGFQDIRNGVENAKPIDIDPDRQTRVQDLVEDIRKQNYPAGDGKAPPVGGEAKFTPALNDNGVFTLKGEGEIRDQNLYKVQNSFKIESVFQTEALPQNLSELNGIRPGYKVPLDIQDIGNGGKLNTFNGTFNTRLDDQTMASLTAKLDIPQKTSTFGLGVANEINGSMLTTEASFKQVGNIFQITQAKFDGKIETLGGDTIGANGNFAFSPTDGKLNAYSLSASLRPEGSATTYTIGTSGEPTNNLNAYSFSAKSDSGTSLDLSTSKQFTQNDTGSDETKSQKASFVTNIYGGLEPLKEDELKGDPQNLRVDGTLSVSAEKTVTTKKTIDSQGEPQPDIQDGLSDDPQPPVDAKPVEKTQVTEQVKIAASYVSTAGTEVGGDVTTKNGTVEEINANFKTPVFVDGKADPTDLDENGKPKPPPLVKAGDLSASAAYKNSPEEKSLEVKAGYEDVGGNGISGNLKTNTVTGEVFSAGVKLVSETQDLKNPPDEDGKYKKTGTLTLEGNYDGEKKQASAGIDVKQNDGTGLKANAVIDTNNGNLKEISGEIRPGLKDGTVITLGGGANFVDKTIEGKLGIALPKEEGALSLAATMKDIDGTYQLQTFKGSLQTKDKVGNEFKLAGEIDNPKQTASATVSYKDGASGNTYSGYANLEQQRLKEVGLGFDGKIGDPKYGDNLKVGLAATFQEGRLDGGKVNFSLSGNNAPIDEKYTRHNAYTLDSNGKLVKSLEFTQSSIAAAKQNEIDPAGAAARDAAKEGVKQAATDQRIAGLSPEDKGRYEQAKGFVEGYNKSRNTLGTPLPVAETAASLTLLMKQNGIEKLSNLTVGNMTDNTRLLQIESDPGKKLAYTNLVTAVSTSDQKSFDSIAKLEQEQRRTPEEKKAALDKSLSTLSEPDKARFYQARAFVEMYNNNPGNAGRELPVDNASASIALLMKQDNIDRLSKVQPGLPTEKGQNLFAISADGNKNPGMDMMKAVTTRPEESFQKIQALDNQKSIGTQAQTLEREQAPRALGQR